MQCGYRCTCLCVLPVMLVMRALTPARLHILGNTENHSPFRQLEDFLMPVVVRCHATALLLLLTERIARPLWRAAAAAYSSSQPPSTMPRHR